MIKVSPGREVVKFAAGELTIVISIQGFKLSNSEGSVAAIKEYRGVPGDGECEVFTRTGRFVEGANRRWHIYR